jgi:hypothetical protein
MATKKPLLMLLAVSLIATALPGSPTLGQTANQGNLGVDVLFLMSRGYGVNYFLDRDRFEEMGWNVIHTGVIDTIPPCPFYFNRYQIPPIVPDVPLNEIGSASEFDAVLMSTTSRFASPVPFDEFLGSEPILNLIRQAVDNNVAVYSICHSSRVLAAAGVIDGKEIVCQDKWRGEIEAAGGIFRDKEQTAVIAGTIVTGARDQYHNYVNTQALATVLEEHHGLTGPKDHTGSLHLATSPVQFDFGDPVWSRAIGDRLAEGGRAICEARDGYLVVGYTFSQGDGDADILAVRTDRDGNPQWIRTFGGLGTEYAFGCAADGDDFVVTGYTTSFGNGMKDVFLLKLTADGNQAWLKTYGGASWDVGRAVTVAKEGDYLIGAYTNSWGEGEEDIYVIKTDRDGNALWSKTYGGPLFEITNSICEIDDGSIVVGASTGSFVPEGNSNACLLKVAADGTQVWLKGYGSTGRAGHGFDWCRSMAPMPDGGAVLVGYADTEDLMNLLAIRTDSEGEMVWTKVFGATRFYDYGTTVRPTADGGIIVGGTTKQVGTVESLYDNNLYLARLDMEGNLVWQRSIGGSGSDWGSAVQITSEGDLILAGHTFSAGAGQSDLLIVKVPGSAPPIPASDDATGEVVGG